MTGVEYAIPNDHISSDDIQPYADLRSANLSDATTRGAGVTDVWFSDTDLLDAYFVRANFSDPTLSGATLMDADFTIDSD